VISPALGAYMTIYHVNTVVTLATAIALLDILFILVAVPESLPEKVRPNAAWTPTISWEQADPFQVPIIIIKAIFVFLEAKGVVFKKCMYNRLHPRPQIIV